MPPESSGATPPGVALARLAKCNTGRTAWTLEDGTGGFGNMLPSELFCDVALAVTGTSSPEVCCGVEPNDLEISRAAALSHMAQSHRPRGFGHQHSFATEWQQGGCIGVFLPLPLLLTTVVEWSLTTRCSDFTEYVDAVQLHLQQEPGTMRSGAGMRSLR